MNIGSLRASLFQQRHLILTFHDSLIFFANEFQANTFFTADIMSLFEKESTTAKTDMSFLLADRMRQRERCTHRLRGYECRSILSLRYERAYG